MRSTVQAHRHHQKPWRTKNSPSWSRARQHQQEHSRKQTYHEQKTSSHIAILAKYMHMYVYIFPALSRDRLFSSHRGGPVVEIPLLDVVDARAVESLVDLRTPPDETLIKVGGQSRDKRTTTRRRMQVLPVVQVDRAEPANPAAEARWTRGIGDGGARDGSYYRKNANPTRISLYGAVHGCWPPSVGSVPLGAK